MPMSVACVERHRSGQLLHGDTCVEHEVCQNTCAENEIFDLVSIEQIDSLSEKIIAKARKLPDWQPHISRLGYLLTLTMHEACMNAVEHGLLGLNKEEKRRLIEGMQERYLVDVARRWRATGKSIQVSLCINSRSVVVGVHDDGQGFDYNKTHFSPMNEEDVLAVSGRGLLILKSLGVRLFWNEAGNTVLCSFRREELAKNPAAATA